MSNDKNNQKQNNQKNNFSKNKQNLNFKKNNNDNQFKKSNQSDQYKKLENENKELKKTIETLQTNIASLKIENSNLSKQISDMNADYVEKIKQKAIEAQKIIDESKIQLNERLNDEVKLKTTLYIEKKFDAILNCINQLNTIVNTSTNLDPQIQNFLIGFKMIANLFNNALSEMDIIKIEVNIGDKFDENTMQAFELVDDNKVDSGCVSEIIGNGYIFNNKVIKHAIVKLQK
ncbi:MAG: nucleotide exchange factor GrpE [Ureaplasma sp.]|nr:nucleotide exchange factor GrpE [Ureaplasma sp.]